MFGSKKFGFSTITYDINDINRVISRGAVSFSYISMPGGQRTMLNYMQSFGITSSSQNTGTGQWLTSFSGDISYVSNPLTGNNFFTEYGRVRIIDGDGTSIDGPDRTIFNFGLANGYSSFRNDTRNKNYAGTGTVAPGGHNAGTGMTTAYAWGFSPESGWLMLHKNTIGTANTGITFTSGTWFVATTSTAVGQASTVDGKRKVWDTEPITHIGFSVQ